MGVVLLGITSYYLFVEVQTLRSGFGSSSSDNSGVVYSRIKDTFKKSDTIEIPSSSNVITQVNEVDAEYSFADCADCESEVALLIESAIEAIPTVVPVSVVTTTTSKSTQTSYIPLGTTSSSTSTDWYTIGDASTFVDLNNDFNSNAYVTFESSLKVKHGNGQAFIRLWDETNSIAVDGSELTTSNNSDYEFVKSGRIYLWNGNNNYKVQLKSLNGFEVTFTGGKVKVVY